mmetsp:Transcript_79927/g.124640  ORF Transcript_79927/g.124640 Transcript_79927/m.124640 type:complete len:210 (-) Transcript_79927:1009-1638(-)
MWLARYAASPVSCTASPRANAPTMVSRMPAFTALYASFTSTAFIMMRKHSNNTQRTCNCKFSSPDIVTPITVTNPTTAATALSVSGALPVRCGIEFSTTWTTPKFSTHFSEPTNSVLASMSKTSPSVSWKSGLLHLAFFRERTLNTAQCKSCLIDNTLTALPARPSATTASISLRCRRRAPSMLKSSSLTMARPRTRLKEAIPLAVART